MVTYDKLLALDNNLKIYQQHLQFPSIEIYKFKNKNHMGNTQGEKYSILLRRDISLLIKNANALWNSLPIKLTERKSLQEFNLLLKQSGSSPCTCSACKSYRVLVTSSAIFNF